MPYPGAGVKTKQPLAFAPSSTIGCLRGRLSNFAISDPGESVQKLDFFISQVRDFRRDLTRRIFIPDKNFSFSAVISVPDRPM
jgi:hypothetical protein